MMLQTEQEARKTPRSVVQGVVEVNGVDVNGGVPCQGGNLRDMSVGGAAIVYPDGIEPENEPVAIDDEIVLIIRGRAHMPGRVVRLFDGGFAVEFDWSINVDRDQFPDPNRR